MPAATTLLIVHASDAPPLDLPGDPATMPRREQATNAADAAGLIRAHRPALLLIDVRHDPERTCALGAAVLADPVTAGLPAVFVTATGDARTHARAYQIGAIDVWTVPLEAATLHAKLRAFALLHREKVELQQALELNRRMAAQATAAANGPGGPDTPLRSILDQLVPYVAVLDVQGTVVAVNRSPLAAAGLQATDVIGRKFWDCSWWTYSHSVSDKIRESCQRAAAGETVRFDIQFRAARGAKIWVDYQAAPVRDPARRVQRLVISAIEIDERKRAQAEASRQTGLVEAVLQACPAGIIVAEPDGRIVRMNPANDRLWGHPPLTDAVAGYGEWKGWWADNSPRAGARIAAEEWTLARALHGEVVTGDVVAIEPFDAPGERRYTINSAAPVRGAYGEIKGGVVVQMDVTELKRTERALRESEETFRGLAENIPQLAWMADREGNIFWFNQRWFDFTGTTMDMVRNWDWRQCHHPDHVERVLARYRESLQAGTPWEDTFPLRRADGVYRWFLSRAFPLRDANGQVVRWLGTNTDITEMLEVQEQLKSARATIEAYAGTLEKTVAERTERLRETVHDLEAFSSSVAHDMRAPLRTMTGYCDILLEDWAPRLEPEVRHFLERIGASAARLDLLITDILDYSHVARRELPMESIDLEALLQDLVDGYPNLRAAREYIRWDRLPRVYANRSALTQVFSNLLSNAVKFMPKGRRPQIRVHADVPAAAADTAAPAVRIWVEDNGIGIDPAHHGKLFQMFQRLSPGKEYEGTGMGLAIARKAVERMGGQIGVESVPNQGSRFWVLLQGA